ncbi:hypothetical protein C8R31_101529 [Nitrosospira sp. Nsp2]|nr:hypothetical protein C8R31_101529 [Nitrosospira sp. Nsp2]
MAIFHSSPATRPLTQRLVRRLVELGERPCVLSDQDEEKQEEAVSYQLLGLGAVSQKDQFPRRKRGFADAQRH